MQQKTNLLSSTRFSVHPSVEKVATTWMISSRGEQTDDLYETVHRPHVAKPESANTLWSQQISGYLDVLPLTAARERRRADGRSTSKHLMASTRLREAFIERFTPLPLARMLMEWQRRSLRRCYRQPLTSHHVVSDVMDRGGCVVARKRTRKSLRSGRRGKPRERYCPRIQTVKTSGGL